MNLSTAEINYLSAIKKLSKQDEAVSTSELANEFGIAAASVTDMVQRLAEKEYVRYEKYKGVRLLPTGEQAAKTAAKHDGLWRKWLVQELQFDHDELYDALQELRKIQSPTIIKQLEQTLSRKKEERIAAASKSLSNLPLFEPHDSEPSQTASTETANQPQKHPNSDILVNQPIGKKGIVFGLSQLKDDVEQLLQNLHIPIGASVVIEERFSFDNSLKIRVNGHQLLISKKLAGCILVERSQ